MKKSFGVLVALLFVFSGCAKKSEGWEMVIHAEKARLSGNSLTLEDVSQKVTLFTKQTPRKVHSASLDYIVEHWDQLFKSSQPNAVLTMTQSNGEVAEYVISLQEPSMRGDLLQFTIQNKASSTMKQTDGTQATLFVDSLGTTQNSEYLRFLIF